MTSDEIKQRLSGGGHEVLEETRLPNDTGVQLRLKGGAIVNAFDRGTLMFKVGIRKLSATA